MEKNNKGFQFQHLHCYLIRTPHPHRHHNHRPPNLPHIPPTPNTPLPSKLATEKYIYYHNWNFLYGIVVCVDVSPLLQTCVKTSFVKKSKILKNLNFVKKFRTNRGWVISRIFKLWFVRNIDGWLMVGGGPVFSHQYPAPGFQAPAPTCPPEVDP